MSEARPNTIAARCPCGAKLRLAAESAGMKIRCPKCRQMVSVPAIASPSQAAVRTSHEPASTAQPRLALAEREKCYMCHSLLPVDSAKCRRCGYDRTTRSYATEEQLRENAGWSRTPDEGPGRRTFWNDALLTLVCFADTNNLIALGFVSMVAVFGVLAQIGMACAGFIVNGWLAGYYITVLEHAASGEEELPPLTLTEGWIDGVFRPALQFAISWIVVMLPALFCGIAVGVGASAVIDSAITGRFHPTVVLTLAMLVVGTFCWPAAIILMVTWSAIDVIRVDRWLQIIGRTLPSYLAMWLMLLAVLAVQIAISVFVGGGLAAIGRTGLTVSLVAAVISTVGWVMTMRIIGLFYFHNRRHFSWEKD